jgi:hypothetical protein
MYTHLIMVHDFVIFKIFNFWGYSYLILTYEFFTLCICLVLPEEEEEEEEDWQAKKQADW